MRVTKHPEETGSSNWHPATRSFGRYAPSRMDLVINPCWRWISNCPLQVQYLLDLYRVLTTLSNFVIINLCQAEVLLFTP